MAIVFPRLMPSRGIAGQQFEIERVDFQSPEAGGRLGGVQAGFPLWFAQWELGRFGVNTSDEWRAWLTSLRGAQRSFLGLDWARRFPKNYASGFAGLSRAGGGAFDGSATSWSKSIDGDGNQVLTTNGLPAGFTISVGDYVGFKWDAGGALAGSYGRRTMARVIEAGAANGSGAASVLVEPAIPSLVPGTAVAHFDEPACVMKIVPDRTELSPVVRGGAISGGRIAAAQDLRP